MQTMNFGQGLMREHVRLISKWVQGELFGGSTALFMAAPAPALFPQGLAQDKEVRVVFITLSDGAGNHVVAHAMALGVEQATRKALKKARALAQFPIKCAKLDLVSEAFTADPKALKYNNRLVAEPSLQGVALESFEHAWLPEESLRYRLIRQDLGIDYEVLNEHLSARIPNAAAYQEKRPEVAWTFVSASFYMTANEVIPLIRCHRESMTLTPQIAKDRALAGAQYLARSVREDGRFVYTYQSGPNREADDYNMVRHAGTTWSMLDLLTSETNEARKTLLTDAIHRAAAYLRAQIIENPWRPEGSSALIMVEDQIAKLGGNGLSMVALVDYYKLAPSEALLEQIRGLAQWILDGQTAEGEFAVHKLEVETGHIYQFISDYYPGEAILGLMRLYGIDPQEKWKESAAKGARWLINVRDKGKTLDQLEHDHWLLYGINEVYREFPEELFLEHTRRLVKAIITTQHDNPASTLEPIAKKITDWAGGWYSPPRTTPAACRVEGLMAAVDVLSKHGEPGEIEPLLAAAEAGIKFQLQNQLWDEKLMYLADPERARGGLHSSFSNWHIRIDYVQHSISAFIAWSRFGLGSEEKIL